MPIRYLPDEHVPPAYRLALASRARDLPAWRIGDPGAPPRGTPDPEVLRWCQMNGFTLVTNNRKSMPRHLTDHLARGGHVPGIFVLSPTLGPGQATEELALIAELSDEDEFRDLIVYLPLT